MTEFLGMNRDKSPFVLTDSFVYVMGGKDGARSPLVPCDIVRGIPLASLVTSKGNPSRPL